LRFFSIIATKMETHHKFCLILNTSDKSYKLSFLRIRVLTNEQTTKQVSKQTILSSEPLTTESTNLKLLYLQWLTNSTECRNDICVHLRHTCNLDICPTCEFHICTSWSCPMYKLDIYVQVKCMCKLNICPTAQKKLKRGFGCKSNLEMCNILFAISFVSHISFLYKLCW